MTDIKESSSKNIERQGISAKNRRKFLINAAIIAPIISTVASKPVWGAGICNLSGSLSGNLSQNGGDDNCTGPVGRSPGYWSKWEKITSCKASHWAQGSNRIYHWHQAGYKPTTSFTSVFGSAPTNAGDTLGAVMRVGAGTDSFERHVVAALLSASHPLMASYVPYTAEQVKSAFRTVALDPYSVQSLDIIDIFDALFIDHEETDLGSGSITISDQYLAELCMIAGVSSPRVDNACKSKKK